MASQKTIDIIKKLLAGDGKAHEGSILQSLDPTLSSTDRRKNSILAVSELLKSLLDKQATEVMKALASDSATGGIAGAAGFGAKINTKYLPSYNVRTPVVTVKINGFPVYPSTRVSTQTDKLAPTQSRINFQSLNLKMPMGGMEKTVQGSLSLFTKNPEEILSYLESWATDKDKEKSMDGLPLLAVTFGWAFSDSNFTASESVQVNSISAMSPELKFMITNVAMEDPSAAGTTFIFTLQDVGSVVLENSSDNLIFTADYPQQQLRALLEGVLRIRLFTLDDILYLGKNNTNLEGMTIQGSGGQGVGEIQETYQKVLSDLTRSATIINAPENVTFFNNTPSCDIGVNNRNFRTLAEDLASQCRCNWYPHLNTKEEMGRALKESGNAITNLGNLAADLKLLKTMNPNDLLDEETRKSVRDHLGDDITVGTKDFGSNKLKGSDELTKSSDLTVETAIEGINKAMAANGARMSTKCRLVWVPNVPVEWNTTGSQEYSQSTNKNDKTATKFTYDEGAFFLLPDILDDYDIFSKDLPVQYGPGASDMPYFYGSAQNVFQASVNNAQPEMFGEVLSLNTSHSTLIATLAQSVNETLAYAVEGKRLTGLQAVQGFVSKAPTAAKPVTDSTKLTDEQQAAGQALLEKSKAMMRDSAEVTRFRSNLATSSGVLLLGDNKNLSGTEKTLPTTDPGGVVETAALRVRSRVANFLRYPTSTTISILGDPNLLRLGPGCFELFSYYPVEQDNGTVVQQLNSLTSGVYFVQSIEHSISAEGFITTLNGTKAVDPINVPSSLTNKIRNKVLDENKVEVEKAKAAAAAKQKRKDDKALSRALDVQFNTVDLTSTTFTSGFLAKELRDALATYKQIK